MATPPATASSRALMDSSSSSHFWRPLDSTLLKIKTKRLVNSQSFRDFQFLFKDFSRCVLQTAFGDWPETLSEPMRAKTILLWFARVRLPVRA